MRRREIESATIVKASIFALLCAGLLFVCLDCSLGTWRHMECSVSEHIYKAAWDETVEETDSDGDTYTHTVHHPEEFHVICEESQGENTYDIHTDAAQYESVQDGQDVTVKVRQGRWTKGHYLAHIDQ